MIGITCRRFPLRNYLDPSNVLPLAAPAYVWNGSCPPYGYDAVAREKGGAEVKKALAIIREDEAASVRRIFDFSLGCADMPLGVKAIVDHLSRSGYRYRGRLFRISSVHRILTATTYTGVHQFNCREARSGQGSAR